MRIRIPLSAGVPTRQAIRGQGVVLASLGAAATVDFNLAGTDWQDMEGYGKCERLFGVYDPARVFTGVELTATVDCVVELIVSRAQVSVMDGATVTATIDAAQLPLPVRHSGVAPTNRSGVIASAGVAQQLMAANAARMGLWVQNTSTTADLWISEIGAATQAEPSIKVAPGAIYEAPYGGCPVGALSIIGGTLGQPFSAREW